MAEWRECEPGCLITTWGGAHTGPCIKGVPGRPGDQTPIVDVELPEHIMNEFRRHVVDRVAVCPDCGCASSVARGCRSEWHQRPGKYTTAAMRGRQAGKQAAYANVDRTFENEFTMNGEH